MSEIKTLADQLRSKMAQPDTPADGKTAKKKHVKLAGTPPIIEQIRAYDLAGHKSMVHARFDAQTAQMLHYLKMAAGIEVNRVICYSVKLLIEQNPELKIIVKQFIQTLEI
jgi:hypothetical protein